MRAVGPSSVVVYIFFLLCISSFNYYLFWADDVRVSASTDRETRSVIRSRQTFDSVDINVSVDVSGARLVNTQKTTKTQGRPAQARGHTESETLHVLRDGKTVKGLVLINVTDLNYFRKGIGCNHLKRLCPVEIKKQSCVWCDRENNHCISGNMSVNGGVIMGENLRGVELEMYKSLEYKFKQGVGVGKNTLGPRFNPALFQCDFDEELPVGRFGDLVIPWVKNQQFTRLHASSQVKRKSELPPKRDGSAVVCGRGLYGDFSADSIAKQVEFYQHQGLGAVIMYEIGLANIRDRWKLNKYIENGSLILVDLRDSIQRLYGSRAIYVLLRTFAVGQMWLKFDCAIRAELMGYDWILHVDVDEYVHPGVNNLTPEGATKSNLTTIINKLGNESDVFSMGSLQNPDDMSICGQSAPAPTTSPTKFSYNWDKIVKQVNALHMRKESKMGERYFHHSVHVSRFKKWCPNYHLCTRSSGMRKLVSRTSVDPFVLRVHRMATVTDVKYKDIDVDDIYIRHHRCVNFFEKLREGSSGEPETTAV
mmetsp:Transcript_17893/g.29035  ORF Transcript_17893/g.29035 Transcript_17893/m.29035 type:complete len:536 (-) Transcript_17893:769-2376(-)|eukprot:CAMPEP_0203752070 /NCGR_PEP_ID=MMETSP0098-20131031/6043_1 /ASSEMBLY_ACC=CAM_ASM_000208 /TAXON_ID=96639 /ORGANISM=" , Strain NY0313808BC1" /LENGTH=535 /DNA_ID=CAMNT_0050642069 /DNA_START=342 /DNA_END=1949 /DNA_ORIENTATION=-